MTKFKKMKMTRQSGCGLDQFKGPLTLEQKRRGMMVIKYVPYNPAGNQTSVTPVCKIISGY